MNRRSDFIIVEGIDGSGKDTQADLLTQRLTGLGRQVLQTTSPSKRYRSQQTFKTFTETGQSPHRLETMAVLGAADRMRSIDEEILPALEAGTDVVCVRYIYSTFGYFKKRGADMKYVEAVNQLALPPSHGVLLALDPEEAVARVRKRDEEKLHFEERDPSYLLDVQQEMVRRWPERFLTVDAALPALTIASTVLDYVLAEPPAHNPE